MRQTIFSVALFSIGLFLFISRTEDYSGMGAVLMGFGIGAFPYRKIKVRQP